MHPAQASPTIGQLPVHRDVAHWSEKRRGIKAPTKHIVRESPCANRAAFGRILSGRRQTADAHVRFDSPLPCEKARFEAQEIRS